MRNRVACSCFLTSLSIASLLASQAFADECPKINSYRFHDEYYDFSFSSWVRQSGIMYSYGRCIMTSNGRDIVIDWKGAGLNGTARAGMPAEVEYPFPSKDTVVVASKLEYGVEDPPDHALDVNILSNVSQTPDHHATVDVDKMIDQWTYEARQGKEMPLGVLQPTSHANLNIPGPDKSGVLRLSVTFLSDLPVETDSYVYNLQYSLNAQDGVVNTTPVQLGLRPQSNLLRSAISFSKIGVEGVITLKLGENKIGFKTPKTAGSTMTVSAFDVVRDSRVVAQFPVSFYAPADSGHGQN